MLHTDPPQKTRENEEKKNDLELKTTPKKKADDEKKQE